MPSIHRVIMATLAASGAATATADISLSNFTPRIENLPSSCQAVYTRTIQGCQASDFTTQGGTCSKSCVQGLVDIQKAISEACANVDVSETSIIGVFLAGNGIPILCPGIEVTTVLPTSTQAQQSSQQATSAPAQQTSTTSEQAQSSAASSTSTSTGGLAIDTTIASTFATSALEIPSGTVVPPAETAAPQSSAAKSSAKASSTASSQKSNADSGGGSPFDVQATGSSSSLASFRSLTTGALLGAVALAFAML